MPRQKAILTSFHPTPFPQQTALDYINAEAKVPDDEGGVELDLSKMTPDAMIALNRYIKSLGVPVGAAPPITSPEARSVKLDQDSDSDDEYSASEDESD